MTSEQAICLSVDVEWAHPAVLSDLVSLFDQRGLRATFFCTHEGVAVPGHERGIHPNFRGDGDVMKAYAASQDLDALRDQNRAYRFVVERFKSFAPEAVGVRGHSLHYDSQLMAIYRQHGIAYDSSYQLPLTPGLHPVWKECGILELPIFYNDYFDLKTGATGFDVNALSLGRPGLKVVNVHPNIVYLNAPHEAYYLATKGFYHDPERLLAARHAGPGARDLLVRLLDVIAVHELPTATLGEASADWRLRHPDPWP